MINYTDFRGATLEKAVDFMNQSFNFGQVKIVAIETKNLSGTFTVRVWWMR